MNTNEETDNKDEPEPVVAESSIPANEEPLDANPPVTSRFATRSTW